MQDVSHNVILHEIFDPIYFINLVSKFIRKKLSYLFKKS